MLQIWGSILMVVSLIVIAGVPTDNIAIMCLLLVLGMIGFAQGFIMLRMGK